LWQGFPDVFAGILPEYNLHGDVLDGGYWEQLHEIFGRYQLVLVGPDDEIWATARGIPTSWDGTLGGSGQRARTKFWHLTRFDDALSSLHDALDLVRRLGSKGGECEMLNQIGFTETAMRRFDNAIRSHRRFTIASVTGDTFKKGVALDEIGRATRAVGRRADALENWAEALELFTRLGVPEAGDVRRAMQESEDQA
jgi:tetratricopeptide (TPR) repeat protein